MESASTSNAQLGSGTNPLPGSSSQSFGCGSDNVELINTIANVVTKKLLSSQDGAHFAAVNPFWKNYERTQPTVVSDGIVNTTPPLSFGAPIYENNLNDSYDEHALLKRVPKQYKKSGAKLLKIFDQRPNEVTWDSAGHIYVDEQVLPNANIFDVFPSLFKKNASKKILGLEDFLQKLEAMGLSDLIQCRSKIKVSKRLNPLSQSTTSSSSNWWYLGP